MEQPVSAGWCLASMKVCVLVSFFFFLELSLVLILELLDLQYELANVDFLEKSLRD